MPFQPPEVVETGEAASLSTIDGAVILLSGVKFSFGTCGIVRLSVESAHASQKETPIWELRASISFAAGGGVGGPRSFVSLKDYTAWDQG